MHVHDNELRVSLREIVEVSYRALRVAGASTGEAQATARAVQFAELRDGEGLVALATDLETGRWDHPHPRITAGDGEHDRAIVLHPEAARPTESGSDYRGGRIPFGRHLIELAAGTGRTVGMRHALGVSSVIGLPLMECAASLECTAVIFENLAEETGERAGNGSRVWAADAGGRLGSGAIDREAAASLPALATPGTWATMVPALPDGLAGRLSWVGPEELERVRFDVARRGHFVDADVWARVRERAGGYLQADRPECAA